MDPIDISHLILPDDLHWRPSNLMAIPNADDLEANALREHVRQEEFSVVRLPPELAGVRWAPA